MDHLAMDHAHGAADGQEETGHGHNEQAMQHAGGHDHMAMMEADARKTRWTHFGVIGLGAWLAASPLVYDGVTSEAVSRLDEHTSELQSLLRNSYAIFCLTTKT